MNIKTSLSLVQKNLIEVLDNKNVNMLILFNGITDSWNNLRIFVKSISYDDMNRMDNFIISYNPDTHYLSEDMIRHGKALLNNLEVNHVNRFLSGFYELISTLTIFNRPFDDCCWRCQGDYQYFYSHHINKVILKCSTCSAIHILPDEIDGLYHEYDIGELSIATEDQLREFNIID